MLKIKKLYVCLGAKLRPIISVPLLLYYIYKKMSNSQKSLLTWAEVSRKALFYNIKMLRKQIGKKVVLAPAVKANAYGHGLLETSKTIMQAGANWLCVNALFEAQALRKTGIRAPIYLMGYVMKKDLVDAVMLGCRLVVYNRETIRELGKVTERLKKRVRVHIKIETGNNRQGVLLEEVVDFAKYIQKFPFIEIEGASTHFANIEDTADSSYAMFQLKNFYDALESLKRAGFSIPLAHCANSAAALLFPQTHFQMVRSGIITYGLWPSEELKKQVREKDPSIMLLPVLAWKTRIAQIKEVAKGEFIGYGCTYQTKRKTRLAILPVGYYDGYDRGFSNKSSVLIHGKRARVLGRVCMNIIMVDVTDIRQARVEDTATLLGRDGKEEITAEELAAFGDTINYEVTTRINEKIPRILVA